MLINRDSRAKTSSNTGVSFTKWEIEYEEPAGDAFKLNHPEAWCLSIAVMEKCGAADDCILTTELTASLDVLMIRLRMICHCLGCRAGGFHQWRASLLGFFLNE